MKKTMLTYKTLDRFEREYKTEQYTPEQIETIEHAAYIANMNQFNNPDWTESDIFADFIRILGIHKIETETAEADETEANEQEEKKMNGTWVQIYSIDNCVCDISTRVLARPDKNGTLCVTRSAFLRACARIGTDEHYARCNADVFTQTGRSEGGQWYNLRHGIRPLSW